MTDTALLPPAFLSKLSSRQDAVQRVSALRAQGPVVFTNGVFDVLHRGHASYLAQARSLGGSLVVALNSDASARRLGKGPDRPLNNELDRAALMAALESVSLVTWFDEDTPIERILDCKPDILVKGGDWSVDTIVGAPEVRSWGGKVVSIPFLHDTSTTAMVTKIRRS